MTMHSVPARHRWISAVALLAGLAPGMLAGQTAAASSGATPAPRRELSLDEALRLAQDVSEDVGIAREEISRAAGDRRRARSGYFPQLTGTASYTRTIKSQFNLGSSSASQTTCPLFVPQTALSTAARLDSLERAVQCISTFGAFGSLGGFQSLPFGRPNAYNFGLSFSQTLFNGGRTSGQSRAAGATLRSAEIGLSATQAQLLLDVTRTYYDAVLDDRLVEIAEATLRQADTTLAQTQLARRVGNQSEFDLLRARVTRDNQRPVVIQRRADRDLAYLRLKQVLNVPLEQSLALTTSLGDSTPGQPAAVAALVPTPGDTSGDARAPVRQAGEAVTSQQGLLKAAKGGRWPAVQVTSSFAQIAYPSNGFPSSGDFLTDWNVAVGLSIPLFTGGRVGGDVQVARATLAQAELRLRQTRELAQLDARNALLQVQAAEASWEASQGTVEQAARAYEIADLRYREGISTQTELSDSRIQLQQAEANRARAARDVLVARTRLALLPQLPLATTGAGAAATQAAATSQSEGQSPATPATPATGVPRTTIQAGVTSP